MPTTPTTPPVTGANYDFLNNLKTGAPVDLSGVKEGFVDSWAARGLYDNPAANEALRVKFNYATLENGTYIHSLRLRDGTVFTGNIEELLESGTIDPTEVAARIKNVNGDFAWFNLQDIVDMFSNAVRGRQR